MIIIKYSRVAYFMKKIGRAEGPNLFYSVAEIFLKPNHTKDAASWANMDFNGEQEH